MSTTSKQPPTENNKPIIRRRQGLPPEKARVVSQQVKVSQEDRRLIEALAGLDRSTVSTWCYHVIMEAAERQRHRVAHMLNPSEEGVFANGARSLHGMNGASQGETGSMDFGPSDRVASEPSGAADAESSAPRAAALSS